MTLFDILERLVSLQMGSLYRHPQLKGLPATWVQILYYLTRCNGYSNTPAATTEYLGLTKGTVSQSLNKLESEGWIRKESDSRDKRVVHLVLTPKACDVMRGIMQDNQREQWDSLPFSEEQLKTVFLAHLRSMQKSQGARLFGECRFCRFHQQQNGHPWCGLTGEPIPMESITLICREFEESGRPEPVNEI
ncbi:MarR family winged helix-turn-helix transcriptional regulator [Citrobacter amalonaticus]|uniref:MarR family winged helix-turn-helix transcriptional regulator n=1 Tax=Citrobacter amalonaticus TaxID=35703 RepID=UPI00388E7326|nr:MarR family transcriptional regulator [Citrobacter amalonaticus]